MVLIYRTGSFTAWLIYLICLGLVTIYTDEEPNRAGYVKGEHTIHSIIGFGQLQPKNTTWRWNWQGVLTIFFLTWDARLYFVVIVFAWD